MSLYFINFIDHTILIIFSYVRIKGRRVIVVEEFLHTALLYQATNTRNINVVVVLEQYLVFVEKE